MSGSINYSLLFSGNSARDAIDAITSLVALGTTGTGSGGNPITALDTAEANETKDVAATEQQPAVQRAIANFTKAVQGATSIQHALSNPDVLNVLLTANGLADQVGYTALAQKALLSDPSDPKSLANQLSNTQWATVAKTYDFFSKGLSALQDPKTIAALTQGYAEYTWRASLDASTPGLSNALDFKARASTITSVDQVLGDATFRTVVTTALGIPPQIAYQDLPAQEQSITSQIDIADFQKPSFVNSITDRYLLASQTSSDSDSSGASTTALAIQAQGLVV